MKDWTRFSGPQKGVVANGWWGLTQKGLKEREKTAGCESREIGIGKRIN